MNMYPGITCPPLVDFVGCKEHEEQYLCRFHIRFLLSVVNTSFKT